jgi:opacity protein-like surface antigen
LKRLLIGTLLAAALSAPASAAELVTNGGFEQGFFGWTVTPEVNTNVNPSAAHSGANSTVFLTYPGETGLLSQTLSTVAGQDYTLSFWIAFATSDPASSALNFYWGGDKVASFQDNATTDYVHIFHVLTATSDSTDLTFLGFSDLGIIVLDDISVTGLSGSLTGGGGGGGGRGGVPEPSAWALMILGFGGVGAALRGSRRPSPVVA